MSSPRLKSPVPERTALQALVVYNDTHNLEVSRSLFVHLGLSQVTEIGGGREALDYLLRDREHKLKRKPNIILFDMELRASNGFEHVLGHARIAVYHGLFEDYVQWHGGEYRCGHIIPVADRACHLSPACLGKTVGIDTCHARFQGPREDLAFGLRRRWFPLRGRSLGLLGI
jgi:hypothetical protein